MLLQLVFSEIGNLWRYSQGHENSSDPISVFYGIYTGWVFFNPGRYLAKRTKVGRVYCNGSVSKNSAWPHSCTVRVCQNNPTPARTHACASCFTHSYKFYINKKKIMENKRWVFIGNIYICCSTKHTGQILQFL